MPAFWSFLLSGFAVWGAVAFLFTAVLAVIPMKGHGAYRLAVVALPIVTVGVWYNLATSEAEKAKPDWEYAWFTISDDPRDIRNGQIALAINATGPLRDVRVAIQKTENHYKGERKYIFYHEFPVVATGGTLLNLFLSPGDYIIDLDAPTKWGRVLERLQIEESSEKFLSKIEVKRKGTGDVLIPSPESYSFLECGFLTLVSTAFLVFIVTVACVSRSRRAI